MGGNNRWRKPLVVGGAVTKHQKDKQGKQDCLLDSVTANMIRLKTGAVEQQENLKLKSNLL